jgi:KTSC domain
MKMHRVSGSSLVKSVGWENGKLRIRFDDATLMFANVSERIYQGLLNSDEPGQYYQRYVYGRYEYKSVSPTWSVGIQAERGSGATASLDGNKNQYGNWMFKPDTVQCRDPAPTPLWQAQMCL